MNITRRVALLSLVVLAGCATTTATPPPNHKQQVVDLLESLQSGDRSALAAIDPGKYVQHDPRVADGVAGLRALLDTRPPRSTRVRVVRVFEDGDFVFAHTEYTVSGKSRIGFDVFRFEKDRIVEHWDNLQDRAAVPGPSGHTMTDGPTIATDLDRTGANEALMRTYMGDLLAGRRETFAGYFEGARYIQHSPLVADDLPGLFAGLQALAKQGLAVKYARVHAVLGEGDFVLVVAEGTFGAQPSAYYDLYRLEDGRIAEHWDTIEAIPPAAEWRNPNGKFGFPRRGGGSEGWT